MVRYTVYLNNKPYISDNKMSEANCEAYMIANKGKVIVKDNLDNKIIWTNESEEIK